MRGQTRGSDDDRPIAVIREERLRGTVRRETRWWWGGESCGAVRSRLESSWSFPGGADCGAGASSLCSFNDSPPLSSSADSYCVSNWQVWIGLILSGPKERQRVCVFVGRR